MVNSFKGFVDQLDVTVSGTSRSDVFNGLSRLGEEYFGRDVKLTIDIVSVDGEMLLSPLGEHLSGEFTATARVWPTYKDVRL